MRWLAVTVGLLVAAGALVGAIYLRDRRPGAYRSLAPTQARADAATVLAVTEGWHCPGCAVTLLEPERAGTWVARLRIRSVNRCVRIDLGRFAFSAQQGLSGVQYMPCADAAGGAAPLTG